MNRRRIGMLRAQKAEEASRGEKYVLGKMMAEPGRRESGGVRFSVSRRLNTALNLPKPPPIRIYDGRGYLTALVHATVTPEGMKLDRRPPTQADKKRYRRIVVD